MRLASQWRTSKQRLGLVGEHCPHCGARLFPPRDVCPDCCRPAREPYQFSGKGEVYSFSTMYMAPEGFGEQAPYLVALVKLEEGPLVTAQLTDVERDEVTIGMPVEMVTRKLQEDGEAGLIGYSFKFRPVLARAAAQAAAE